MPAEVKQLGCRADGGAELCSYVKVAGGHHVCLPNQETGASPAAASASPPRSPAMLAGFRLDPRVGRSGKPSSHSPAALGRVPAVGARGWGRVRPLRACDTGKDVE